MTITIDRIELRIIEMPLAQPFTISGGTLTKKEGILLQLFDRSGLTGYGEAPLESVPIYLSETLPGGHAFLRDVLLPKLLGVTIPVVDDDPLAGIRGLREEWSTFRGFEFSKASVEQALCDLAAQMKKISLQTLFGGTRKTIDVGESLGIKPTISATLEEVDLRLQQGFKRIKLKIKPGHDQGLVDAVRKAHPDIPLMVDANSAYTLSDVVLFKSFDQQNLMMIEQPLSYDDILDHAALAKEIKTPICLDESILCLRHARQAVELGAAGIINIKPSRVGGPLESMAIHDLCLRKKIPVWCGGMFETGIGRAFNIALASLEGFTLPADMSPSSLLFTYDLVSDPFEVVKGEIAVRTTPGLGFTPDQDAIKRATIHTDVVAA